MIVDCLVNFLTLFFLRPAERVIAAGEHLQFRALNVPYSDSISNPRLHFLRAFSNES